MLSHIPTRYTALRSYKELLSPTSLLEYIYNDGKLDAFNIWLGNRAKMESFFTSCILPSDEIFSSQLGQSIQGLNRIAVLTVAAESILANIHKQDLSDNRKGVLQGIAVGFFDQVFGFDITPEMKGKAKVMAHQQEARHPIEPLLNYLDKNGQSRVTEWMKGIPANSAAAFTARTCIEQAIKENSKRGKWAPALINGKALRIAEERTDIDLEARYNTAELIKAFFAAAFPDNRPKKNNNALEEICLEGLTPPRELIPEEGPVRTADKKVQALFDYHTTNDTGNYPFSSYTFYTSGGNKALRVISSVQADRMRGLFNWLQKKMKDKPTPQAMQALVSYRYSMSVFSRDFGLNQANIAETLATLGIFQKDPDSATRALVFSDEFIAYWMDPQARKLLLRWSEVSKAVNLAIKAKDIDYSSLAKPKLA